MAAILVRHANVDVVLIAGLGVGVRHRRDLSVAKQADKNGLRHVGFRNPEQTGLFAIDLDVELGTIFLARGLEIHHEGTTFLVGELAHLIDESIGVFRARVEVVAKDFDVDGCRGSEVLDTLHNAADEEIELRTGHGVA